MIYLYYSNSKEKDLVESWAKYGTKMGFTTYTGNATENIVSADCESISQYCTSADIYAKNVSYDYDTICTTSNLGKLSVSYSNTITQDDSSLIYSSPIKSNYIVDPLQLEHKKVKQIIKFKPI